MRKKEEWSSRELGTKISLVLGWREGSRARVISAGRVTLSKEIAGVLREQAVSVLSGVKGRTETPYDPSGHIEDDGVVLMSVSQLPTRTVKRVAPPDAGRGQAQPRELDGEHQIVPHEGTQGAESVPSESEEASALITLLENPSALERLPVKAIKDRRFAFYALVFTDDEGQNPISFVSKHNPAIELSKGTLFGSIGDSIQKIDHPVLLFKPAFDLLIDGNEMAVLSPKILNQLFADIELAAAAAPAFAASISLSGVSLSASCQEAIVAACRGRRRLSQRLQKVAGMPHVRTLTVAAIQGYLARHHELDEHRFIADGEIAVEPEDVADLLEILASSHFRDAYSNELRLAQRSVPAKR